MVNRTHDVGVQTSFYGDPDPEQHPTQLEVGEVYPVTEYDSIRISDKTIHMDEAISLVAAQLRVYPEETERILQEEVDRQEAEGASPR